MEVLFISAFHPIRFDTRSFYRGGLEGVEGKTGAEARAQLDYAEHSFTGCNVNYVSLS